MNIEILKKELTFRTSRSGGKGGQNVNKVETKVEVLFDVNASEAFTETEKELVLKKLNNQLSKKGILSAVDQTTRSQLENHALAIEKLIAQIEKAFVVEGPRLPTLKRWEVLAFRAQRKQKKDDEAEKRL
jgi:ribosome-associated protein